MPAGPYPLKVMHEALKTRVETLENAPGGGGQTQGGALHIGLPSLGSPTAPTQGVQNLTLRWVRRTVVVAGFRLAGNVPAGVVGAVGLQRGPYGNEIMSTLAGNLTLTRTPVVIGGQPFTDYLFGEAVTLTDAALNVGFTEAYAYPVSAQAELVLDGVTASGVTGFPYLAVLSSRMPDAPIVPVPSEGTLESSDPALRLAEVVWPASGAPYLHVTIGATDSGDAEHFHLPLTPGLPQ